MPSCNTSCLTWVSLTADVGYLFTAAPAKCSRCSLPRRRGIFSQPPLLTLNVEQLLSALLPPQQLLLGGGLLLLATAPDLMRGSSPRLLLLRCGPLGISVATPDLGRGVASHGHASARSVAAGVLLRFKVSCLTCLYLNFLKIKWSSIQKYSYKI